MRTSRRRLIKAKLMYRPRLFGVSHTRPLTNYRCYWQSGQIRHVSSDVPLDKAYHSQPTLPSSWLGDIRNRLRACAAQGLSNDQSTEFTAIQQELRTWKHLLAGSEGYLVGQNAAIENREVEWGEMVGLLPHYPVKRSGSIEPEA